MSMSVSTMKGWSGVQATGRKNCPPFLYWTLGLLIIGSVFFRIAIIAIHQVEMGSTTDPVRREAILRATRFCRNIFGSEVRTMNYDTLSKAGKPLRRIIVCCTTGGEFRISTDNQGEVVGVNRESSEEEMAASPLNHVITSSEAIWIAKRCLAALSLHGVTFQVKRIIWNRDTRWELDCRCQQTNLTWKDCRLQIDAGTGRIEYCYVGKDGAFSGQ
jgi:hypothetical protein